ncbi:MAG: hypothetical protein HY703_01990, partial [Gemmatimonadetes bacterium]|nr:hypothetical protein [Gemmatimonadota bacterium]
VRREVLDTLVPGARGAPLEAEPVSATPGLAPLLVLAARTQVAPALGVEAAAGWTFAQLRAREGSTDRDVQDLGVVHAVLGLRYHLHPRIYLRGGLGGIRYLAEREGLFREGSEVKAVLEVAGGARWRVAGLRLAVEAMAQAHSFGTVAQRRARGLDGTVYRGAVQVGVAFGGDWP